jgi:hypothetical protein
MAPTVELFINNAWVDITTYVRVDPGLTITFGIPNESATADPATCNLTVNNRDGRFSPRNASGPYYPYLTRNTPLRVTDGSTPRFAGEVSEFPARWNLPGTDVWTPLVASGILRRLNRANAVESTLVSGVRRIATTTAAIVGYWPMEDLPGSTSFAADGRYPTGPGTIRSGSPILAAVDPGVGSKPIPTFAGSIAAFVPAVPASTTGFTVGFYVVIPSGGTTNNADLMRLQTGGTADLWILRYNSTLGGQLQLIVKNSVSDVILLNTVLAGTAGLDGKSTYIKMEAANSGANIAWYVQPYFPGGGGGGGATLVGAATTNPQRVELGSSILTGDVGLGQLILGNTSSALFFATFDDALEGFAGETAQARSERIEALTGIPIDTVVGTLASTRLGPQPDGTPLDVLRDMEKADVGSILRDSITQVGLSFMTRSARYSRAVTLALDYAAGHLSPPLEPTDDDQFIRNDVTAVRTDGSSARAIDETGPLNVQEYPDGIGPYSFSDTYNVYLDSQLPDLAAWLLGQGTIEDTRWPKITVDLVANPSLVAAVDLMRPGYRMTVANIPTWQGTGAADLFVIGWTEQYGPNQRTITFNCEPGGASTGYDVFILNDTTFGVLDSNRLAL